MQFVLQLGHTLYQEQAKFALRLGGCSGEDDATAPCYLDIEQKHCHHLSEKMALMSDSSCLSMGLSVYDPKLTHMFITDDTDHEVSQSVGTYLT